MAAWRNIINFFSYIALMCIAIALVLSRILEGGEIIDLLQKIAQYLAYITVAFCAFSYADHKWGRDGKRIWYLVFWLVAVILIVVHWFL